MCFTRIMRGHTQIQSMGQKYCRLVGMCCHVLYSQQIFHLFRSLQNLLNGKTFDAEDLILTSFSQKKKECFMNAILWSCTRDGERSLKKTANILLIDVHYVYSIFYENQMEKLNNSLNNPIYFDILVPMKAWKSICSLK